MNMSLQYAVFDPNFLVISDADWERDESRSCYLEHLTGVLEALDNKRNIHIAWSDECESIIWSQMPWRKSKHWNNSLVPILYKRLNANIKLLDIDPGGPVCEIVPSMCIDDGHLESARLYETYTKILGHLNRECDEIKIALGLKNIALTNISFVVNESLLHPEPVLVRSKFCLFDDELLIEEWWPNNSRDSDGLIKSIFVVLQRDYSISEPLNRIRFSRGFLKKLSEVQNERMQILTAMAKRLSMTAADAGTDASLRDKPIQGKNGERRFRVSQRPTSRRIHYIFRNSCIEFLMFYDVGEHDDGL